jgi:electron transport complex protein RnfD
MKTMTLMQLTLAALIPGIITAVWLLGPGVLLNLIVAVVTAITVEAAVLKLRHRSLEQLTDGSAVLTGTLLALCLPPLLPFWMVILGTALAMLFGKHIYGGLGQNVFNPAMVGFAILIVSFPLAMSQWPTPDATQSLRELVSAKTYTTELRASWDGMTGATPLDAYRFREGLTNQEFFGEDNASNWTGWVILNLAFLVGGLFLVVRGIIRWQAPVAFLSVLTLLTVLFYDSGSSASLGSPLFHLFSGATMLTAFFILTDPVTCPADTKGLLVFGGCIALITFIIRSSGAYPEGVAFAVLLMNGASPLIDHLVQYREQYA